MSRMSIGELASSTGVSGWKVVHIGRHSHQLKFWCITNGNVTLWLLGYWSVTTTPDICTTQGKCPNASDEHYLTDPHMEKFRNVMIYDVMRQAFTLQKSRGERIKEENFRAQDNKVAR